MTQQDHDQAAAAAAQKSRKTARMALLVVATMVGLSFASVPAYRIFCQVTGFAGTTQVAEEESHKVLDQTILVQFDASIAGGMPWEFKPTQKEMRVRLGENALATYTAHNPTDHPITGQATYNVAPYELGGYFAKIDCFCFTEQTLQPGETVEMPVTFYVDPELAEDSENNDVKIITLSYTFFEKKTDETALAPEEAPASATR